MRVAYIHGFAGMSGAMLLGALLDTGASLTVVQEGWRQLRFPPVQVSLQRVACAGYTATCLTYAVPPLDAFLAQYPAADLRQLVVHSGLTTGVQQHLLRILDRFVAAVQRVYGMPEAGQELPTAAISEVLYMGSGVALALDELAVEQCLAAPLHLGVGWIETPKGRVPMPRPLTAELVRGVPVYGDTLPGEPTTVAGAAILTALATRFGPLPTMTVACVGYGIAESEPTPGGVQVLLGDVESDAAAERITVLEANIDDMNPEFYEDIFARLFAQGALDVTLTPLFMKKNRPANKLTVLAPLPQAKQLAHAMLRETSTFGVRAYEVWRQKLERFWRDVETCYGVIQVKCGVLDGQLVQAAPEYEACKRAAHTHNVPVRLVYTEASRLAASWLMEAPDA
jgi:uncharacterized protein (TIGR00299 family) protein